MSLASGLIEANTRKEKERGMSKSSLPTVKVEVTLEYARRWNGSCYEATNEGVTASVMAHWSNRNNGISFAGCPLGRTTGEAHRDDDLAIKAAICDFVARGKSEYRGPGELTVDRVEIVAVKDHRRRS